VVLPLADRIYNQTRLRGRNAGVACSIAVTLRGGPSFASVSISAAVRRRVDLTSLCLRQSSTHAFQLMGRSRFPSAPLTPILVGSCFKLSVPDISSETRFPRRQSCPVTLTILYYDNLHRMVRHWLKFPGIGDKTITPHLGHFRRPIADTTYSWRGFRCLPFFSFGVFRNPEHFHLL